MARKVATAQVQIACAYKANELDQHVGVAIWRRKQPTFNNHFWQGTTTWP